MKKIITALSLVLLFAVVSVAQQKTTWSQREVRDPRMLARHLEANATDAETRIASLEGSVPTNAVAGLTGVLKADDGVVEAAVAGTDYLEPGALTTNIVIGVADVTNTIVVVKGLITEWTVENGD